MTPALKRIAGLWLAWMLVSIVGGRLSAAAPPVPRPAHGINLCGLADCFAETPLCTIDGGHYPGGNRTRLWEGDGKTVNTP